MTLFTLLAVGGYLITMALCLAIALIAGHTILLLRRAARASQSPATRGKPRR